MSMPIEVLVKGIEAGEESEALIQLCLIAGLETAIDLAMVDATMHAELLVDDLHLRDLLVQCVEHAKTFVDAWEVGVT